MAAIRLLLGDKILPPTVATNTRIADTLVFAQFKYDQSMDIFLLLLIVEGREKAPPLERYTHCILIRWLPVVLQLMSGPMMDLLTLATLPDKLRARQCGNGNHLQQRDQ